MTNTEILILIKKECPNFNSHTFCETVRVMTNGSEFKVRKGSRKTRNTLTHTLCYSDNKLIKLYIDLINK